MGVLNNGMSLAGFDTNIQKIVKGAVLLGAVTVDLVSKRKKRIGAIQNAAALLYVRLFIIMEMEVLNYGQKRILVCRGQSVPVWA